MSLKLRDGFLDSNLKYEVDEVRKNNIFLYKIIKEINDLLYELEKNCEKKNPTHADLYIFTTFSQIHTSYQSCIILLERGLYDDSQIVFRSIYDKVFKCRYVLDNTNNLDVIEQDNISSVKSLNNYIITNNLFSYASKEIVNESMNEVKKYEKLDENGKKYKMPDCRKICEDLGIKDAYIHYKLLSNYTHSSMSVINSKLLTDKQGWLINQGINHGNFYEEISRLIVSLTYIIKPMCDYIKNDTIPTKFDNILARLINNYK